MELLIEYKKRGGAVSLASALLLNLSIMGLRRAPLVRVGALQGRSSIEVAMGRYGGEGGPRLGIA